MTCLVILFNVFVLSLSPLHFFLFLSFYHPNWAPLISTCLRSFSLLQHASQFQVCWAQLRPSFVCIMPLKCHVMTYWGFSFSFCMQTNLNPWGLKEFLEPVSLPLLFLLSYKLCPRLEQVCWFVSGLKLMGFHAGNQADGWTIFIQSYMNCVYFMLILICVFCCQPVVRCGSCKSVGYCIGIQTHANFGKVLLWHRFSVLNVLVYKLGLYLTSCWLIRNK